MFQSTRNFFRRVLAWIINQCIHYIISSITKSPVFELHCPLGSNPRYQTSQRKARRKNGGRKRRRDQGKDTNAIQYRRDVN